MPDTWDNCALFQSNGLNPSMQQHLFARPDKALYLAGVLLQDIQLDISPPRNPFCLLETGRERFGYLERTSVEMVGHIYGPEGGTPLIWDQDIPVSGQWVFEHTVADFWHQVQPYGCPSQLIALGPGRLCHNCGNYSPSGSLLCWRCGGHLDMVDFIRPVTFPFKAATGGPRNHSTNWQQIIAFDLVAEVDDVEAEIAPFFTGNPRLLPAGCSLDTGLYLCKYCGYAVPEGEICPGCGGERVPLMELISLDRECRYCGSTMRGGIVCPDCGARIAGMALRQLWRDK